MDGQRTTTKAGFQGMTAHWIEVKEGKWKMKVAVIGFKALSGGHSGENLGRYSVGLLDCVGIMDKTGTKVCRLSCHNNWVANSGSLISFTQQHWTIREITTQPAKQSRIFTGAEALNGTAMNNNYHSLCSFIFILLNLISLYLVA